MSPVDENLQRAQDRMKAARADDSLRTQASGPLSEAARTLAQADETKDSAIRHHFTYMTEKNLDIADAIIVRKRAEQELEALRRRQNEARSAPPLSPAPAAPGRSEAEANLVREMERERLETRKPPDQVLQAVLDVHFAAGATELSPGAERRLDPLVVRLRDDESIHVLVEGYTDGTGSHEANLQISLARARAVKSYLVEQGIPEERVQTLGLGAQYPVAGNDTEEGRQRNRRVEIVLDRVEGSAGSVTGHR